MKRLALPMIIMVLAIGISSCYTTSPSIQDIQSNESRYLYRDVTVQGLVTDVQKFPFRKDGIYRIFDEDHHSIWIYREEGVLPKRGDTVTVTGQLRKKDDFRKRLLGAIIIENINQ
jgi:predicted small secreted protein